MKKSGNAPIRLPSFVICHLIFVILAFPAFAQEKDLTINAQNLNYSDDGKIIEASGSVEVAYKDLTVKSDRLLYFSDTKRIQTETGFDLSFQEMNFSGLKLDFDLSNKTGIAEKVSLFYKNAVLNGKSVKINPNRIDLNEADFTTCDLSNSHYHFHSKDMSLLLNDGWLLCYWSIFWIDGIPMLPVPIYFYDFKALEKGQTNTVPFPQFGSNDQDGSYVTQSFPWQANARINGNITFGYAEKKGVGFGLDSKYALNDQNSGVFKIFGFVKDPVTSILNHKYYFGPMAQEKKQFEFRLFELPKIKQYELSTIVSLNDRINYERVSMLPLIKLSANKTNFQNIAIEGHIGGGFVTEESTGIGLGRASGGLNFSMTLFDGQFGKLSPILNNEAIFYGSGTHWIKTIGGLQLENLWSDNFSSRVGFTHFILNRGASPYNYENYRIVTNDQISAGFLAGTQTGKFGMNVVYNLPNMEPQEFDYIVRAGIHCFSLIINYRVMRKEFDFGFAVN